MRKKKLELFWNTLMYTYVYMGYNVSSDSVIRTWQKNVDQ